MEKPATTKSSFDLLREKLGDVNIDEAEVIEYYQEKPEELKEARKYCEEQIKESKELQKVFQKEAECCKK